MQELTVFPFMLEVPIQNNLQHRNDGPRKPHEPTVGVHDALLCIEHGAITGHAIELDVEKAQILMMI